MEKGIVFFDGTCALCCRAVRFLVKHDRKSRFRFQPMESKGGAEGLGRHDLPPVDAASSLVLLKGGRIYLKSDAVQEIARHLPWPWRAARLVRFLPKAFRDRLYDLVARNRYRWFGRARNSSADRPCRGQ